MGLTIYKSSAGSGKTYTLVRAYLTLVIRNPFDYRHILAITFTNKATEEMKSRIIVALSRLATGNFDGLKQELLKILSPEFAAQGRQLNIERHAYIALTNILHNYSQFSVSTIDSFFQKIIRHFAKELRIPMNYEIEMDSNFVLEKITVSLLQDIGHVAGLTDWLEEFVFAKLENDKGWKIEKDIQEVGKEMLKEKIWQKLLYEEKTHQNFSLEDVYNAMMDEETPTTNQPKEAPNPRELRYEQLKETVHELWKIVRTFRKKMKAYGKEAMELINGYGLNLKDDFKAGTANFFVNIQEGKYERKVTLNKIYAGAEKFWPKNRTTAQFKKVEELVANGLQDILMETIQYMDREYTLFTSANEVLKNIYVYGILHDLKDKLRNYRTEQNTMLISDINSLLNLVISADTASFVYEKVGMNYKHILLDEFQDTSNYQWKNLQPLLVNSLSEDNTALIVGDVKQSIYRWRGGNMGLLLNGVKKDLPYFFTKDTEKILAYNYRSRAAIVQFNNAFFEQAVKAIACNFEKRGFEAEQFASLAKAYSSVKQEVKHEEGGLVNIQFIAKEKGDEQKELNDKTHAKVIALLQQLKEQGVELKDIAFLVRTNKEGSAIAELLSEHQIQVVSSESLLLKKSPKVRLLISILQYLGDKRNMIAKTEILVNYWKIHQQQLEVEETLKHAFYTDHLTDEEVASLFYKVLPTNLTDELEHLVKKPLYELIETLVQILEFDKIPDAYIQRFQDLMLEFNMNTSTSIRHFLDWWKDNEDSAKTSIIVPAGENAVNIITIHKAKGLEFPIVIMPYCHWSLNPNKSQIIWSATEEAPFQDLGIIPLSFTKELQQSYFSPTYQQELIHSFIDNLNTLYVAFTRPVERLYVFAHPPAAYHKDAEKFNTIGKLLDSVVKQFEYADKFEETKGLYQHGEETDWSTHEMDDQTILPLSVYLTSDYHDKITIRSDSERLFMLFDNTQSTAIKMGQKIHAVLEKIIRPNDLDKVLRKLQIQNIIQEEDVPFITTQINRIFALPIVVDWFDERWEILSERPLLRGKNQYIPDRVMIHNNKAIVVDYKTGQEEERHKKQLNRYAGILSSMGYQVTHKFLLYIAEEVKIIEVFAKE